MATIRAIYLMTSDNKSLFSRRFLTVENRLKKKMGNDYTPWPKDSTIINSFYNQIIKEELLQEEFKCKTYIEDLEIDHQKMEELIEKVDININVKNFQNYSECPIVTLDTISHTIWPCIYIKKYKLYGIIFPNIDVDRYNTIKENLENENKQKKLNLTPDVFKFKLKKLYEEQDLSILGSFILIENLLNYVIANKTFEENQLHTLISNMVPFGNIVENNINFMLKSLNSLSTKAVNTSFFNNEAKKPTPDQDKIKVPGWVTYLPTNSNESLKITIKEELKFVKFGTEKHFNTILCDISCLSQLKANCEITLPIKENGTNYLGNLRIHPCAKIEKQEILNDSTRIIFIPPAEEFKMGVFEIENVEQKRLPIIAEFSLKESSQNEVKLFLNVVIDESAINKFEYFYINIPLGHFGTISGTKIMVQVGEVSLVNNKTTLHWNLQNKVFDSNIVLSGTVNYYPKTNENMTANIKKEDSFNKNDEKDNSRISLDSEIEKTFDNELKSKKTGIDFPSHEKNINIDDMIKIKSRFFTRSDIMSTNCFCKIHFKLNEYSISNIEIDKKSLLFYPKVNHNVIIRREFVSNDYIVWNTLSFNNYEINIPQKFDINLLKIDYENKN